MTKFLVKKNGVYYLTTGRLLEYDRRAAKDKQQEDGVAEVEKVFDEIRNSPHTWYEAVEINRAGFGPMNTGQTG